MRKVRQTNTFKHDLKKITNRSKNLNKLYEIVEKLVNDIKLEIRHKPHKLIGEYKNKFECHIEPDWLFFIALEVMPIYFNISFLGYKN